jgi:hypothetical protein
MRSAALCNRAVLGAETMPISLLNGCYPTFCEVRRRNAARYGELILMQLNDGSMCTRWYPCSQQRLFWPTLPFYLVDIGSIWPRRIWPLWFLVEMDVIYFSFNKLFLEENRHLCCIQI